MEQNTNQTYTIEEKTGKIIKVEEANEKQKRQKLMLRAKIVALCTAIGVVGIAAFSSDISKKSKSNNQTTITKIIDDQTINDDLADNQTIASETQNNYLVPNSDQIESYLITKSGKASECYNNVVDFFSQNGNTAEFPDDLVEAFYELGQENFDLAIRQGLVRYNFNHQTDNKLDAEQQKAFKPNSSQAESYIENEKKDAEQYYYQVMNFFDKNGEVNEFPDELVKAFFELGQDNFELAKQTGLYRHFGYTNKETENQDSNNSIDTTKESETEDMISHKTSVYLEEDLINGEWIGVNLLSRNTGDVPLDTNDKRYILCGATEENINNLYVYQKETRSVSADSNGTYQIESDWTPVMEFNVTANPLEIPHDTLDSRYVIVACGNNVASMIGELNSQIQAENTVTAGRTR